MSFLQQDVPLSWYLLLSAILFSLGVVGFLIKRNLITIFMSIELMLNAVNLSFVTFAHQWQHCDAAMQNCLAAQPHAVKGQIFVFFVMMVAAAEAAVGLGAADQLGRGCAVNAVAWPVQTDPGHADGIVGAWRNFRFSSRCLSAGRELRQRLCSLVGETLCRLGCHPAGPI